MSTRKPPSQHRLIAGQQVELRRSARRKRSVQAYRDGERIVVLLPAALSSSDQQEWAERMVERVLAQEARRATAVPRGADDLHRRAAELSARYLDGRAEPTGIRWVTNQAARWGSCTPSTGQIRLSHRLQGMPGWVIDYVLLHELAHLIVPGHGPRFAALMARYEQAAKAEGFLRGVSYATGLPDDWGIDGGDSPA